MVKFATTKARRKLLFNRSIVTDENNDAHAIAQKLNIDVNDVYSYMEYNQPSVSLYDEDDSIFDLEDKTNNIDSFIELDHDIHQLASMKMAMKELNARELDIINRRYLSEDKLTLHDLARIHNVSYERIRQIEVGALKKIKHYFTK